MSKFDDFDSTVIGADGTTRLWTPEDAMDDYRTMHGIDLDLSGFGGVGNYYDVGDDIDGDDIDGDDDIGDEHVSGRGRTRRTNRHMRRNPPSVAAIERAARARGMVLAPMNPNQNGRGGYTEPFGQKLLPTGQRRLPAAFVPALAVAAGAPWSVTANVQRGFQGQRFILSAVIASSGADARGFLNITDLKVNNRTQPVSNGSLSPELFSALAFGVEFELDPAGSGNIIELLGSLSSAASGPVNIFLSAVGKASR